MRKDLAALLRPLEQAKHHRRRAALRSRAVHAAAMLLFAGVALLLVDGGGSAAASALLLAGLVLLGVRLHRLARIPDPVPVEWLQRAVEIRLSREGRAALTPMLLAPVLSCDAALAWGHAEQERFLDLETVAGIRQLAGH